MLQQGLLAPCHAFEYWQLWERGRLYIREFVRRWKSGSLEVWESENRELWKSGNLEIWESWNLEVWKSRNLEIWGSGNLTYGIQKIWNSGILEYNNYTNYELSK